MFRYFAASAIIVVAFILALLALPGRDSREAAHPRYGSATGTPGPPQRDAFVRTPQPVTGDAPWALSALPECFEQRAAATGTAAFARARLPAGARRLAAGITFRVADCSVAVGGDSALVIRGDNRLRIPPDVRFYVSGPLLAAERRDAGRDDVRVYALRAPLWIGGTVTKPWHARRHSW